MLLGLPVVVIIGDLDLVASLRGASDVRVRVLPFWELLHPRGMTSPVFRIEVFDGRNTYLALLELANTTRTYPLNWDTRTRTTRDNIQSL